MFLDVAWPHRNTCEVAKPGLYVKLEQEWQVASPGVGSLNVVWSSKLVLWWGWDLRRLGCIKASICLAEVKMHLPW